MPKKNTNTTVRYKRNGLTLEILVKPNTMKPYREGKLKKDTVLLTEEIFSNASKFQKAKNADLKKCCGSKDKNECLQLILDKGDFPLTKKELTEMVQVKRREIINYLHKYYQDPKQNPVGPHPVIRIENALDTMKVKIDPHTPANIQVRPIVKKLPEILPVKPVGVPEETIYGDNNKRFNSKKGGKKGKRVK